MGCVGGGGKIALDEREWAQHAPARTAAVVTGASSGIGRSIVERLCGQQVNVVMVALNDDVLATAHREISARFPAVVVRKCGVDLSDVRHLRPALTDSILLLPVLLVAD